MAAKVAQFKALPPASALRNRLRTLRKNSVVLNGPTSFAFGEDADDHSTSDGEFAGNCTVTAL